MSTPTRSQSMNEDFPLIVTENPDGSWTFEWDENHPVTSIFNTWTEEDFLDTIRLGCEDTLGKEECDRIKEESNLKE